MVMNIIRNENLLKPQDVAKCTQEFVLYPLPKSLGLCYI
jgi:hypothetical protein